MAAFRFRSLYATKALSRISSCIQILYFSRQLFIAIDISYLSLVAECQARVPNVQDKDRQNYHAVGSGVSQCLGGELI